MQSASALFVSLPPPPVLPLYPSSPTLPNRIPRRSASYVLRSKRGGAAEVLKRTEIQLEPGRTTNLSSGNEVRVRFDVPGNSGPLRMKDINRPKLIPGCYSNCKLSAVNYVGWILEFVLIPRLRTERLNIEIREAGNFGSQRIDERSAGSEAPRLSLFTTFIRAICMHICTHTSISFHHRKGGVVPSFFFISCLSVQLPRALHIGEARVVN